MGIEKFLKKIKANYSLVILLLGMITINSCNQNINQNMNTVEGKIKKIASWKSPDQYISTDAVVTSNNEVLLLNSSKYYFSMSPSVSALTKQEVSKELVRIEQMGNDSYLMLAYEEGSYICYLSKTPKLEGAEVIDLGTNATEISYNEETNSIWFVNTSKGLMQYDLGSKSSVKLSDLNAKSIYLSSNNKYAAFEGVDDVVYSGSTSDLNGVQKYTSNKNTELLGVTDDGHLVLLELGLAEKGGNNQNISTLVLIKGSERKVLITNCNYNWAVLQGKHIVASSSDGEIALLELID